MPEYSHHTAEAANNATPRDARYRLSISRDQLLVTITVTQTPLHGGRLLTARQLHDDLKQLKIKYGINDAAIDKVISIVNQGHSPGYDNNSDIIALACAPENGKADTTTTAIPIIIAAGQPPETGSDARLDWIIDLADTDLFIVVPGDLIAKYQPPQNGKAGKNVFGHTLKAHDGRDTTLQPGPGIEQVRSNDAIEYRAKWYGHCHATDKRVDVTCPISISPDRMSATMDFYPPADMQQVLTSQHISDSLQRLDICCGIEATGIHETLNRLAQYRQPVLDQTVARGQQAIDGQDTRIDWANELRGGTPGTYNIRPGYLVATRYDASPGKPGWTIYGEPLPCQDGKTLTLEAADCIHMESLTGRYTSLIAGTLNLEKTTNGYRLTVDPHLTVSEDGLEASLYVTPLTVDGIPLTKEHIYTTLYACGISHGICDEQIQQLLSESAQAIPVSLSVARGTPPQHGVDAYVHYIKERIVGGELLTNGRIDFHEHHYPWTVKSGETIGYFMAAREQIDGTDVRGQPIAARPPKTLELSLEGAHLDEKNRIVADIDGTLIINGNALSVTDLLVIDGDVGPKTGNIHCDNHVHVKGYIKAGFRIQSGHTIIIDKNVENAAIICSGNVTIKGGIRGMKSEVFTPGDIHAGFIEHATISVNGDITVAESVINSEISSNGVISVGSPRARHSAIIGGHTRAFKQIESHVLGSQAFHHTVVSIGFTQEMKQLQLDLRNEIATREQELEQLQQLENFYQNHNHIDADEVLRKARLTREKLIAEIRPLQKKLDEIGKEVQPGDIMGIIVYKKIYPGVTIKIDDQVFTVSEEMNGGIFMLADGNIVYKPELPHQDKGRRRP